MIPVEGDLVGAPGDSKPLQGRTGTYRKEEDESRVESLPPINVFKFFESIPASIELIGEIVSELKLREDENLRSTIVRIAEEIWKETIRYRPWLKIEDKLIDELRELTEKMIRPLSINDVEKTAQRYREWADKVGRTEVREKSL